jgi:hypothetical protein
MSTLITALPSAIRPYRLAEGGAFALSGQLTRSDMGSIFESFDAANDLCERY